MQPAALTGAFVKLVTMADGAVRITVDLDAKLSEIAGMGLSVGTPLAIAVLTQQAAQADLQQKAVASDKGEFGHYYTALYKSGWFNSPQVRAAFDVSPDDVADETIKNAIYSDFEVDSLSKIEPKEFALYIEGMNIGWTLPALFKGI